MLIALFSIALITFAVNFANDNESEISLADDDSFVSVKDDVESEVDIFYEGVNTSNTAFQKSTISSQTEASEGGTQFKVTPTTSVAMATKSLSAGWKSIFGEDSGFGIFFTALVSMVSFIMILYAYKSWVGRNPD